MGLANSITLRSGALAFKRLQVRGRRYVTCMRSMSHTACTCCVLQEHVDAWRLRRMWRAWAHEAVQQQRGRMLADKAAMVVRLQQWHQRLTETGQEVSLVAR